MVSGDVSRFRRIPDTPEMTSTDEEDADWGPAFLMSFPLTIRDQANTYHAAWKKKGYGSKATLSGLREQDLINMKFLEGHARLISGQMDLMFAPVPIPVFFGENIILYFILINNQGLRLLGEQV